MLPRALAAVPVMVLLLGLAGCGEDAEPTDAQDPATKTSSPAATAKGDTTCEYDASGLSAVPDIETPPAQPEETGKVPVTMDTSVGELHLDLDAKRAPCTVNSFLSLTEQGYFDKTTCHRMTVDPSQIFVLQCGDPQGEGTGGPGYTVPDEVKGDETYGPGVLAMANTGQPDSGGSQFFIVYDDSLLSADYTIFGTVDAASLQIIENVAADGTTPPGDGAPKTPVDISTVAVADRKPGGKKNEG